MAPSIVVRGPVDSISTAHHTAILTGPRRCPSGPGFSHVRSNGLRWEGVCLRFTPRRSYRPFYQRANQSLASTRIVFDAPRAIVALSATQLAHRQSHIVHRAPPHLLRNRVHLHRQARRVHSRRHFGRLALDNRALVPCSTSCGGRSDRKQANMDQAGHIRVSRWAEQRSTTPLTVKVFGLPMTMSSSLARVIATLNLHEE